MSSVQKLLQGFDGQADFRGVLEEMQEAARSERDFALALRIGRTLRSPRLFNRLYDDVMERAAKDLAASPRASEFGDGEFAKWFLEWFSNGGWQVIIEFIKALIPLFGGLV